MKLLPVITIGTIWFTILLVTSLLSTDARADRSPSASQLMVGDYVISLQGSFKSAPPPFTGDVLKFDAAIVGVYHFDRNGLVSGNHTIVFSHAAVPFDIVSRNAISGTYEWDANGLLVMQIEEDSIEEEGGADGIIDNTLTLECYAVHSHLQARCVMHTLVTFQRGPNPMLLPSTLSGSLERRH